MYFSGVNTVLHSARKVLCPRQLMNLDVSNFEYLFWFFPLRLPEENNNKYSKFDTSKSIELPSAEDISVCTPVKFLVFCSCNTSNPDHINLTFINSDVCSTVEILGPLGKKSQIRALQYPHSSQKCICLAVNDHVMLYDVTKKKIRQDFQKIPNVTCLTLSQTDKYIAAGNSNGYLYLLNPLTGRSAFTHPIRISGDNYWYSKVQLISSFILILT